MADARDNLPDTRLASIARGEDAPTAQDISDMAAELLRLRRLSRGDSRRSLQVRRLRWMVEHVIIKLEQLADREKPHNEALVVALCKTADKLDGLLREVRALPLELEEISVASLVAKWLRSARLDVSLLPSLEVASEIDELAARIERGDWKEVLGG